MKNVEIIKSKKDRNKNRNKNLQHIVLNFFFLKSVVRDGMKEVI